MADARGAGRDQAVEVRAADRAGIRSEGECLGDVTAAADAGVEDDLDLGRAGKLPPVPIEERPLAAAQSALDDLRAGRVVGRVVLTA